jgi:regulation of enolase protein 1 (concanavalin A-like superfamily)
MLVDRRQFVDQFVLVAGALSLNTAWRRAEASSAASPNDELLTRMSWMNEPASAKITGGQITVRSREKTDFWQKTFDGYVADSGHFFHLSASGDFTFTASINGKYATQYDQAGLMVRVDPESWMRCGTEFIDGKRCASVVFTRTYSDGSTLPDLSQTEPIWWRLVRKKDSIETLCSLDGAQFMSVRMGYFPPLRTVDVGIMCAAPSGPGFDASFKELRLETSTS